VNASPLERLVDDPKDAGDTPDRRGKEENDAERNEEPPEYVQVVLERLQHLVPYLVP
jgi:hypothetical protein